MSDGDEAKNPATATGDGGSAPIQDAELEWLQSELLRIRTDADHGGVWGRRDSVEEVRFCKWDGQSADGRKHREDMGGREPFPFEGAMDSRIRLADMIIDEDVMVMVMAALQADMAVRGTEINDEARAGRVKTILTWILRNKMGREWVRQLTNFAQYGAADAPAVGVMAVFWKREWVYEPQDVPLDEMVVKMMAAYPDAQAAPEEQIGKWVDLLTNEARTSEAEAVVRAEWPIASPGRIRKALESWRKGMPAELLAARIGENRPHCQALKMYDDVFIPFNARSMSQSPVVYWRQHHTKAEVLAVAVQEKWSADFKERLIGDNTGRNVGQAGKTAFPDEYVRSTDGSVFKQTTPEEEYHGLYETFLAYWKATDPETGIGGVYWVRFAPGLGKATDKKLMEDSFGEYPFIEYARETLGKKLLESRGWCELVGSDQNGLKLLDDAFGNHAQTTAVPPVFVPAGRPDMQLIIAPHAQIKRLRPADYEYMKGPEYPRTAKDQQREIRRRVNEFAGRYDAEVAPQLVTLKMQWKVNRFLYSVADVLRRVWQLCQKFLTPTELARIAGGDVGGVELKEEIQGNYDVTFTFDAKTLDPDYVIKMAETVAKYLVPLDTEQTILRSKMVRLVARAMNPNMADEALRPVEEANLAETKDEETNIAKVLAGVEPEMMEGGQNFSLRLQVWKQWREKNPDAIQKFDPASLAIMEQRIKHLDFQVQQEQNKIIGRTGAAPALG